jgi:hypothetical protein
VAIARSVRMQSGARRVRRKRRTTRRTRGLRQGKGMIDGGSVRIGKNRFLEAIPAAQRNRLMRSAEPVVVEIRTVLVEPGEPIDFADFPMLGCRRAAMAMSVDTLKTAGFIRHRPGRVVLVDVPGLEAVACECYETVRNRLAGIGN